MKNTAIITLLSETLRNQVEGKNNSCIVSHAETPQESKVYK